MNLTYLRSLAARFFRRSQTESELEEELRAHIQLRADDLERAGLGRTEAERRARIEFGGHERFKEESRETSAGNFLDIGKPALWSTADRSLDLCRCRPPFHRCGFGGLLCSRPSRDERGSDGCPPLRVTRARERGV